MRNADRWAAEVFGRARLGDQRRTQRLVRLAAEVARKPAGTVTRACTSSASREGAFRFLENSGVSVQGVREAVETAAVSRCRDERLVFVPIDGTSLSIADKTGEKGLGRVGTWRQGGHGVHVMTAIAVTASGATLGVCGQRMWTRHARSPHGKHGARGKSSENRNWLDVLSGVLQTISDHAPACKPWFQMDRGADCWQVLALSQAEGLLMTVRATHDRRVDGGRLWSTLTRARVIARRKIDVPARPPAQKRKRIAGKRFTYLGKPRPARSANVAIRAATVDVRCTTDRGELDLTLNAVLVHEKGRSEDRVEWMLLTTHPIRTRRNVLDVVRGYTLRWRIEDFHRAWKRGLCRVEDTQLRSRDAIFKWATILAAVATRAMRLTQLARTTPDASASTEFSRTELEAIVALRQPKTGADLSNVTLAVVVRWVADIGGYTGPWNGPPGATVIGRGLHDVLVAARAFEARDKKR